MALSVRNPIEVRAIARRAKPEPHDRLRSIQTGMGLLWPTISQLTDVDVELLVMTVDVAIDTIHGLMLKTEFTSDDRDVGRAILEHGTKLFELLQDTQPLRSELERCLDSLERRTQ